VRTHPLLRWRFLNDPAIALPLAVAVAACIAALDYTTDYELRFGVAYVPAVILAAWAAGRLAGIAIAVAVAALWLATISLKEPYADATLHLWEAAFHLIMCAAFALLAARLREALVLAEERFVSAFDSLDTAAWVTDPASGAVLYANRHFRGELPEGESFDDRSGRWFYVLSRAMRWLDGRSVRLQVATDISEAKRAEALARAQQEQLERTARLLAVGEMAATLAHELNQPLGAVANYTSAAVRLLQSGSPDTAQVLSLMEKCGAQALRAGDVVHRIREFVRKRPPVRLPERADALIADALAAAEGELQAPPEIHVEVPAGLPRVAAERVMIARVMLNLVRNGLEAMAALPGRDRVLAVRAEARGRDVEFQFADRGCGIPQEMEGRLFQPFFSTKADGMGLGLAICRSIVEYHRGELWFTRNPEGGTTFHFTLPVAP